MIPTATATFEAERSRLLGLAYRITGSRTEAEDVVQDAWLRWERADPATVDRPAAWLTTVTSRLALDRLKSAQRTREAYVGPWLPEPVAVEEGPEERAELAESLTLGFLTVLERLSPVERVVFLLTDVFSVPSAQVAEVVGKEPEACRQIASRARRRVREGRPKFEPTDEDAWQVTMAFLAAAQAGDLEGLLSLLAEDAVALSDGGALQRAARRPIVRDRIPRFIAHFARRGAEDPSWSYTGRVVNGRPAVALHQDGVLAMVMVFEVVDGKITSLLSHLNREKLAALDLPPIP